MKWTQQFLMAALPFCFVLRCQAEQPVGPTVIKLVLHPAATSQPALQYQLLPPMSDMRQGDAAYNYAWSDAWFPSHRPDGKKIADLFEQVSDSDRESFSIVDASALMEQVNNDRIHDAARCEDARWDINFRNKGTGALLPFLGFVRESAQSVSIEGRLALAKGDFPRANYCLQTQFAMVRQLNNDPFLVQGFTAAKIGALTVEKNVTDWIVTDESPNLFWALTNLPSQMIDLAAIEHMERSIFTFTDKPHLSQALDGTLADEDWPRVVKGLAGLRPVRENESQATQNAELDDLATLLVAQDLPAARKYLVSQGLTDAQAAAVPENKAVGSFWVWQYKVASDEQWKGWNLSYPQAAHQILLHQKRMDETKAASHNPLNRGLFDLMNARFACANLDRQIALMRVVEALRDYTARHDGKPPASLDRIADLPIPLDPITGNAFTYHCDNETVFIDAPAPVGIPPEKGLRYELTFALLP